MSVIQILAETEYQDLYRVTDGVLLVVNKFKPIIYPNMNRPLHLYSSGVKTNKYNKGCQDSLKILKKDFYYEYNDITVKKDTVMYQHVPVKAINDAADYEYQIKTTGDLFKGNAEEMEKMLSDILYRIRQGKIRD